MDVDVAVLGGGPGGYTAAIRAAQLGARVACIDRAPELGGTCLRIGCIPTKAWVQTALALKQADETFGKLGVKLGGSHLDFPAANKWKTAVVKRMTGGVAYLFKANDVAWVNGTGTFTDAHTLAVTGGEDVTFTSAIIATGSFPLRPPIEGLESGRCVDSEGLLAQTEVPRRLVILGGGVIERKLSELQGADPMVLVLSRGAFCPKDRQQHRLLVQMEPELKVAYTKIVTISTDAMMEANEMRDGLGAHWPFLIDPERTVQRDLDIAEYTDPYHNPMIPYTLVLEPGLVIYSVYNGYWYWGRPAPAQLRADLRAVTEKVRPDWDITAPGQRDAWDRGDKSAFWPYGVSLREVFAADPSAD